MAESPRSVTEIERPLCRSSLKLLIQIDRIDKADVPRSGGKDRTVPDMQAGPIAVGSIQWDANLVLNGRAYDAREFFTAVRRVVDILVTG